MRLTVLLPLGGILLASLPAHAELRGVTLYERGDYVRARQKLTEELNTPGLSKEEQAKARLYLAAALFASGAEQSALKNLEELAALAPSFKVDPILFPPAFVALAEKARATAEAQRKEQEKKRLEAERLEQERREREEALARQQEQPEPEPEPTEEAKAPVQLRPDVFGFVDAAGKSVGLGGGMTLGLGMVDVNARVLLGTKVGVGGEVGVLLGSGPVQPRLALRGTAVPGAAAGGGGVVGLRLGASDRLTVLLDVGAEYFSVDDKDLYRSFVLTSSAGVGFDLL
jgi:tetratricopeptide (TPR) repeat protein